jgi:hypothetical protein
LASFLQWVADGVQNSTTASDVLVMFCGMALTFNVLSLLMLVRMLMSLHLRNATIVLGEVCEAMSCVRPLLIVLL